MTSPRKTAFPIHLAFSDASPNRENSLKYPSASHVVSLTGRNWVESQSIRAGLRLHNDEKTIVGWVIRHTVSARSILFEQRSNKSLSCDRASSFNRDSGTNSNSRVKRNRSEGHTLWSYPWLVAKASLNVNLWYLQSLFSTLRFKNKKKRSRNKSSLLSLAYELYGLSFIRSGRMKIHVQQAWLFRETVKTLQELINAIDRAILYLLFIQFNSWFIQFNWLFNSSLRLIDRFQSALLCPVYAQSSSHVDAARERE